MDLEEDGDEVCESHGGSRRQFSSALRRHRFGPVERFSDRVVDSGLSRSTEWRKGKMTMQYLLLIYQKESEWAKCSEAEKGQIFQEYMEFAKSTGASGNLLGGEALQPVATATTVRVKNGKTLTTDGPFAETKEQLGGYFLIEAKNLDEATAIAARIPDARTGSIEVRPILPTPK
jgi:hypothetical protein